ncbi:MULTISPECIES: MFS transporter [unclassified Streptomyces]|uniref:MFS transporter n=1 Tax=unclassified Streptomyces TaxID=2593676 RepID=UPI00081E8C68|nr:MULTISPECIES: MFS transporter [unclassified Streptomyces]SCD34148.1 Major Facilitator Superfamily protein [Streptomyces sp. ScaeMP-e83]
MSVPGRPRRRRPPGSGSRLLPPMVAGTVLNPVNSSMLAVALIPIGRAFDAAPSRTAWLVSALYLATAVAQPVAGRLVDLFGPRRLYLLGAALAGCAGLLGALAPSLWVLVVSRVLLGLGTSAAYPASMSLLRREADRTGRSPSGTLAVLSISSQAVSVAGPALGGLLIGAGGWQLIFLINVPLSAACLVLGAMRLPKTGAAPPGSRNTDSAGVILFAVSLTACTLFLMEPAARHWYLPVVGAVAGGAFVHRELRTGHPFLDLRVLGGNLPLLATYCRQFLGYTTLYTFLYGYTQWLQDGRGIGSARAGLIQMSVAVTVVATTAVTGRRPWVRGKLIAGALFQLLGCAGLLLLDSRSPLWLVVLVGAVFGIPHGLVGLANDNALSAQADSDRIAASAGLMRTFMYLGALVSSATTAAFYHAGATSDALHRLTFPMIGVTAALLLLTLADRSLRR